MNTKLLHALTLAILFLMPNVTFGQAPYLGSAANFVLFSGVGAVTNSSPSLLTGNVGSNGGSSTGFGNVNGVMDNNNGVSAACYADLHNAYLQLNSTIPNYFPSSLLGGGDTLVPGVYQISAAATMNGNLILNAQGDPNAVFIFQIGGSFATGANSKVILINGGLACNVFWKVEGLVSMASGTTMRGTVIANNAGITMSTNDTLEGRALSTAGAVSVGGIQAYTPIGCGSPVLTGPAAPALGSTACYGLFSANGPVSNAGVTHVSGDVGTNVGLTTGFNPLFIGGAIHPIPDGSTSACAADLLNVYSYLNTLPADIELLYPAQFGNNLVLTPHTYVMNSATTFTGTVYLDGAGDSNAVFVLQLNGALTTSTFSNVILTNGTQAKNVFWKVEGQVQISDYSVFNGTVICNNGAISLNTGVALNGRALTTAGALGVAAVTVILTPGCTSGCSLPAIVGTRSVCLGSMTTLTNTDTTGTWSSSNTAIATVGSGNGAVTGIAVGTATITYTNGTGCTTTATVSVNTLSAISGSSVVCIGSSITLTDAVTGGTWSSSNTAIATVGSATGIVTGTGTGGIATITYSIASGCSRLMALTVNSLSAAISGASTLCLGSTTMLTDATTGGTWSSSNTSVATVNTSGVVTASASTAGTATISYNAGGCGATTKLITVNSSPSPVQGVTSECVGAVVSLSDAIAGGTWSSNNANVSVDASGNLTALSAGTSIISYTLGGGCYTTYPNTIHANPAAIMGTAVMCIGGTTALTDTTSGSISWTSSNTAVATTINSGAVTGVSVGTAIITYKILTGSCFATQVVTVNGLPAAISGNTPVCAGSVITLSDSLGAGTWSSSSLTVATVGSSTGTVTGVAGGTTRITYTAGSAGCKTTAIVTVNAILPISGNTTVCTGTLTTLTDATAGGTWSSGNTGIATVGASTGIVTGVSIGSVSVIYTLPAGCTRTATVNVGSMTPITGSVAFCAGTVSTLSNATTGGTWNISSALIATIGSASGTVTASGTYVGTATISYSLGGCVATQLITVNANPKPIQGVSSECAGTTITLSDLTAGGTWSSTPNVSIGASTGIMTAGAVAGTARITYTMGTGCSTVYPNTIYANPSAILGTFTVCIGTVTALSDLTSGAISWTSSNTSVATSINSGAVTGVSAGTSTITYKILTGSCFATQVVTVNAGPAVTAISGPTSISHTTPVTLSDVTASGVWTSSNAGIVALSGSTGASVTASAISSTGSAVISYTVMNGLGCKTSATLTITATPAPPHAGGSTAVEPATVIAQEVLLYPNPSKGAINIKTAVAGTFYLYSLDGRELGQYPVTEGVTNITLPNELATGMYMGRYVGIDGNIALFKISKQ